MIQSAHPSWPTIGRLALAASAMLLIWIVTVIPARSAGDCLSTTGDAAVTACRSELLGDPNNVEIRLALSDAYMSLRRYADAVAVLREGFEHAPGDERIKRKLVLAESYLDEQRFIEKKRQKEATAAPEKNRSTQVRLSLIRCTKLTGDAALAACNEGLDLVPDHPELLTARGRVWLEMDRLGNAILDFESALAADPGNRDATKNLRLAQTRRSVKVTQCLQGEGAAGLAACDAALVPGAADASKIQKRRAVLRQAMGRETDVSGSSRAAVGPGPDDLKMQPSAAGSKPEVQQPSATQTAGTTPAELPSSKPSSAESSPAPEKKASVAVSPPAEPRAKIASVQNEPPPKAAPMEMAASPEKSPPEKIEPPPSVNMAAVQPRAYSNAPRVPGITH